jgi:hypothetical protein
VSLLLLQLIVSRVHGVTASSSPAHCVTELVAARQQVEDSSDVTLPAAIDRMVAARTAFAQIQQAEGP